MQKYIDVLVTVNMTNDEKVFIFVKVPLEVFLRK